MKTLPKAPKYGVCSFAGFFYITVNGYMLFDDGRFLTRTDAMRWRKNIVEPRERYKMSLFNVKLDPAITPHKADKGLLNGSCNRGSCQKPGATYYNIWTHAHYCRDCARKINWNEKICFEVTSEKDELEAIKKLIDY